MSDVCWPSLLCTVCTVCMLSSSAQIHLTSVSISEWLCNIGDQQEQQEQQRHTSSLVQWPLYYTGDWWISGDVFFFFLGALSIPAIMYLRSPLWTVGRFLLFFFLLAGVRLKVVGLAGQMHTDGWATVPSLYSISIWIYTAPVTVSSASRFIDPTGGISTTTTTPTAAAAKGDVCLYRASYGAGENDNMAR